MVASRDIKAGETVFKEAPLTFGPSESSKPICLGQWFLNFLCIYPLFHIFDGFHTALIKIKFLSEMEHNLNLFHFKLRT